jgi:hypothetical protein
VWSSNNLRLVINDYCVEISSCCFVVLVGLLGLVVGREFWIFVPGRRDFWVCGMSCGYAEDEVDRRREFSLVSERL